MLTVSEDFLESLSPFERAKFTEQVALIEEAVKANPLIRYNNPIFVGEKVHVKQLQFHASFDPLRAYFGGNRAGKTTSGLVDDVIQAIDAEAVPAHLKAFKKWQPPFDCRIVAPDFKRTIKKVMLKKLKEWIPRDQLLGGNFEKAWSGDDFMLYFANGSSFQFMSYEQDLDKFGGDDLHRCHYDEEPPEDIRKECMMRLLDHDGDEVFTMTPLLGFTWMLEGVYERRHEAGFTVIEVDMDDNPWLSEKAKARILDGLTEDEIKARKRGKFTHFGGLVYKEWDEGEQVITQIGKESIAGCDVVVGIDPGTNNTGLVWVAFDDENMGVVFHSMKLQNYLIDAVVAEIRAVNAEWEIEEPDYYVIDPSAVNRSQAGRNETIESAYNEEGIYPVYGENDVEAGTLQIRRRLHHGYLLITDHNAELIDEFSKYRVDTKVRHKFQVIKENDHILDALRYVCMSRPHIGDVTLKKRGFKIKQKDYGDLFVRRRPEPDAPPLGVLT